MIENGILLLLIAGSFAFAEQSSFGIQTVPKLPENKLATGYSGLQLTAQIQQSNNFETCRWTFNQETPVNIYTVAVPCRNHSKLAGTDFALTCVRRDNVITSTLIVHFPIRSSSVVARLECAVLAGDSYQEMSSVNLNITECAALPPLVVDSKSTTYNSTGIFRCPNNKNLYFTNGTQTINVQTTCLATAKWSGEENAACFKGCNVTYPLVVISSSTFYNSSGTFSCANNGTLFRPEGPQPTTTKTTCLATAEWMGQNGLECGKAEGVAVNGNLIVTQGDHIVLTCDYEEVWPIGNQSSFSFGEVSVILEKGHTFTIPNLKRSDNGKPVSCQALTPFTAVYSDAGRSDTRTIKVFFAPFQDNPATCTWFVDLSQTCKISFYANTNVSVLQITKDDGTLVDGIVSPVSQDGSDLVSFYFGLLKDVTYDDAGSYQVQLTSVVPPNNHIIYFEVNVVENPAKAYLIGLVSVTAYALAVSLLAFGIYLKLSKNLKSKDQNVYFKPNISKDTVAISDRAYLTIDNTKSSPEQNIQPAEYLVPSELKNDTKPLPVDGYENVVVAKTADWNDEKTPSTATAYESFTRNESKLSIKNENSSTSKSNAGYEIMKPKDGQK